MSRESRARLLVLATLVAAGALVAWGLHHFDVSLADPDALAEDVRGSGALAPLLLVLLLILQSVVAPLPSQPVLMAAGFVYGPWWGLAIGWLGVWLGAVACFGIARLLGRPAVVWFVNPERLAAADDYVCTHGLGRTFAAILSLRLFAHFSFDLTSYACGLVRFPFGWFALATGLGEVPKVGIFVMLGAGLGGIPGWLGVALAVTAVATLAVFFWMLRGSTRSAAAPASRTSRSTS